MDDQEISHIAIIPAGEARFSIWFLSPEAKSIVRIEHGPYGLKGYTLREIRSRMREDFGWDDIEIEERIQAANERRQQKEIEGPPG